MSCKLCNNQPIGTIRKLDRDINSGDYSVAELAEEYGFKKKAIRIHMKKCLGGAPQTGYAALQSNLKALKKMADEVKEEYGDVSEFDEDGPKIKSYAFKRYLDAQREIRETIMSLDRIKPSEELVAEIVELVVSPLVTKTSIICIEEIRRFRTELSHVLGKDYYDKLDSSVKETLIRIGERLNQESNQLIPNLRKVLNTENTRKKAKTASEKQLH